MTIDIEPRDLATVHALLRRHVPEHEVRAFGSRVRGTSRRNSDLDLAIMTDTPLDAVCLGELRDALSESDLPFQVDLLDWATVNGNFRRLIEERYEVLQSGKVASR